MTETIMNEIAEMTKYDNGPQCVIEDVAGLNSRYSEYGSPVSNTTIGQITFRKKLSAKMVRYVTLCQTTGSMMDVFNIGRVMNKENCSFEAAAKKWHSEIKPNGWVAYA